METLTSSKTQSWLIWFLKGLLVLGSVILVARLIELQVIKGSYYRSLAEGNRIRRVPIYAPRGLIYARGGETLVGNGESRYYFDFSAESGFEKKPADDSTPDDEIIGEPLRQYPLGSVLAHIAGYLGETNETEAGKVDPACLEKGVRRLGSWVGRSGLEQVYDCYLRGIDGEEMVEVDTFGKKVRTFARKPPIPGEDLVTTIDYGLQRIVANRLRDKKGAIVVSNPKGELLALYSSPSFEPDSITSYLLNTDQPLFNRALSGEYHPGSIFKIVTAVAALEEKAIDPDFKYEDKGFINIDDFTYRNWYFTQYGATEGLIDMPRAFARSTDTYFYKIGELAGIDNIAFWAGRLGYGKVTAVDLPGERPGLVPTPEWKKAVKGENWYLGNTYHISIGQGDLAVTPLQANMVTSVIASKGFYCPPHFIFDANYSCNDLEIDPKTIELITRGMSDACSVGGTAFPFFDFRPQVACKTGTAETSEKDVTHAWFTLFAPVENPEIVMTVLIEKGGEGSSDAAPLAKEILEYWFHNKNAS